MLLGIGVVVFPFSTLTVGVGGCPRVLKNSVWIDESVMDYLRITFGPSLTGNCEVYCVFPGSEMILLGTRRNMMQMVMSVYFFAPLKSIIYLIKGVLVLLPHKGATLASWVRLEYFMGATYIRVQCVMDQKVRAVGCK